MNILRAPLETLSASDIDQLAKEEIAEGIEIELKQELPTRDGKPDGWLAGGSIGEYARNSIAQEIVAFANTFGGAIIVGIEETDDHPKRAKAIMAVPRVHDLARRLQQAVYGVIDPPLPMLEAIGIDTSGAESGVVVLRVPPSRRRPHRLQSNKEVYVRRADETVRIGMREIQELTIQSLAEATRVASTISDRRSKFSADLLKWTSRRQPISITVAGGIHMIAVPTTQVDLGRVVGRPELVSLGSTSVVAKFPNTEVNCSPHIDRHLVWKPGLRLVRAEVDSETHSGAYQLETSGICEFSYIFAPRETFGIFIEDLVGQLGSVLSWIETVRTVGGDVANEFALAIKLSILGKDVLLAEYKVRSFAEARGRTIPIGDYLFPIMSIGGVEDFPQHLRRFDEDIWNIAGHDFQRDAPEFELRRT